MITLTYFPVYSRICEEQRLAEGLLVHITEYWKTGEVEEQSAGG